MYKYHALDFVSNQFYSDREADGIYIIYEEGVQLLVTV